MIFFTSACDFPQKEQRVMRADLAMAAKLPAVQGESSPDYPAGGTARLRNLVELNQRLTRAAVGSPHPDGVAAGREIRQQRGVAAARV